MQPFVGGGDSLEAGAAAAAAAAAEAGLVRGGGERFVWRSAVAVRREGSMMCSKEM